MYLYFVTLLGDGIQLNFLLRDVKKRDWQREDLEKIERVSLNRAVCYCSRLRCGRFDMSDLTSLLSIIIKHRFNAFFVVLNYQSNEIDYFSNRE